MRETIKLHTRLSEILFKITEHIDRGSYKYEIKGNRLVVDHFDLNIIEFIEAAVKEKIEGDRKIAHLKEDSEPFPEPRCESCSHYRVFDKDRGYCHWSPKDKPQPVIAEHSCSKFDYFLPMTKNPDPPDRCSDCQHKFEPKPDPPLRLCPFCGSSEVVVETTNMNKTNLINPDKSVIKGHRVFCAACGCRGPERLKRNRAIEIWNSRPGDDS